MSLLQPRPLRVVIAEDHVLLREGMANLLREYGVEVVAETGDATELLNKVSVYRPDVAVTDVHVRRGETADGLHAALRILAEHPEVGVLVLSESPDEQGVLTLLGEHGRAVGYLHKDRVGDVSTFVDAIARVARGESALDRDVVSELLERRDQNGLLAKLRPRERDVLAMMVEGRSNAWIARSLRITLGSVEQHVSLIFAKLDLAEEPDEEQRVATLLRTLEAV